CFQHRERPTDCCSEERPEARAGTRTAGWPHEDAEASGRFGRSGDGCRGVDAHDAGSIALAVLVDTNVLVDIAVRDPVWLTWSRSMLARVASREPLTINPIIYAEFSVRYDDIDEVDYLLPEREFRRESLPWTAAFAAGAAFRVYRKGGGVRDRVLPDFLIGAHAA